MSQERRVGDPNDFIEARRRLLQTGVRYFIDVSRLYPASVAAQSAGIALRCKESRHDPLSLLTSVSRDPASIHSIISAASAMHQARNIKIEPSPERVVSILQAEAEFGQQLMIMDPPELEEMLARYETSRGTSRQRMSYALKVRQQYLLKRVAMREI